MSFTGEQVPDPIPPRSLADLTSGQRAALLARLDRDRDWYGRLKDRLIKLSFMRSEDTQQAIEAASRAWFALDALRTLAGSSPADAGPPPPG
ncbi:MAG: hypothetical protein JWO31_1733 [Phycisphaerales bacterium]|nr:hypothetical protein [Phycisphaerales bacterium]